MNLPTLDFTALRHFPRAQESLTELRICFESPLESVQESRSTVNIALVVTLVSSTYPATDSFPAIFSAPLGNSKRAGILGERCVPLVEKHWKDLPNWKEKQYLQHFRVSKDSSKIPYGRKIFWRTAEIMTSGRIYFGICASPLVIIIIIAKWLIERTGNLTRL